MFEYGSFNKDQLVKSDCSSSNNQINSSVNPYHFATIIKDIPIKVSFVIKTSLETIEFLSESLNSSSEINRLATYLQNRSGKILNINMTVQDCSEALGCDVLADYESKEYQNLMLKLLEKQNIPVDILMAIKIIRKPMQVYSHMDVDIPVQIEFEVEYTPKYKGEDIVKDLSKKIPDPKVEVVKAKSNNYLSTIAKQRKILESVVTYQDPITYTKITRKAKESFYGIWYLDILNFYESELLKNPNYNGIVDYMLYGIPMEVQCYDPEAFGNLTPTIKSWSLIDMEAKIRYFNDGLDVRIGLDYGQVIKPEFNKRVKKAYQDGKIPLECWQTGVYVYPASKRVLDYKVHSIEARDRMSEKDWNAANMSSRFYVAKSPSDNESKMLKVFNNK